ncbi:hypothetical protein PHLCEN_2v3051 [Hermanssonia centrifuga]|uniref:Uncharacterized protein n=1 Tax=Hermanssonia centrifuga TaxID=98765 RepID=A0A2R6R777_9APHY|nr:hypothetical protein PHLCEN_2v3051 [Hermanssonia centrifuga]
MKKLFGRDKPKLAKPVPGSKDSVTSGALTAPPEVPSSIFLLPFAPVVLIDSRMAAFMLNSIIRKTAILCVSHPMSTGTLYLTKAGFTASSVQCRGTEV